MNFLTGITNLTNWTGNVIMPTLAALFFALGVLRYAHGQAHTYAPWAGFLCLMVSGVLRGIEKFAAQAAWNNPDLVWITMRGMVNWTCNVFLPVYAVLQLLHGFMLYAGIGHRMYAGGAWMRHFSAAGIHTMTDTRIQHESVQQLQYGVDGQEDIAGPIHHPPHRDPDQIRVIPRSLSREFLDAAQDTRDHQAEKAGPRRVCVRLPMRIPKDPKREE